MKAKILLYIITSILSCGMAIAQTLERSVISSTGSLYQGKKLTVSSTLGEVATTTMGSPRTSDYILYQGFQQQENDVITAVPEVDISEMVEIAPVPTRTTLTIKIPEEYIGKELYVYTSTGKLCQKVLVHASEMELQVTDFKSGIYFIRLSGLTGSYKIIKE